MNDFSPLLYARVTIFLMFALGILNFINLTRVICPAGIIAGTKSLKKENHINSFNFVKNWAVT